MQHLGSALSCAIVRGPALRPAWFVALAFSYGVLMGEVRADSLNDAIAAAYTDNSQLNAARAQLRATDEVVPQAVAGFRPVLTANGSAPFGWTRSSANPAGASFHSRTVSVAIQQPLFLGFRTVNGLKQAKAVVEAARAQLRASEQDILLQAVQVFMDVVEAQVALNIQAQDVKYLRQQLVAANERFKREEGTKTDIAQTTARLNAALSGYSATSAQLTRALAAYDQVIGHKPKTIGAAAPIEARLPRTLDAAIDIGLHENPAVLVAVENVDIAEYNVKILEGALLPSVTLSGSVAHTDVSRAWIDSAALVGSVSIPIYEGGRESSAIRAGKETLGQRRIDLDQARSQTRQQVIDAWATLEATRSQVTSAQSEINAQKLALEGVTAEQKVGERTLLDVLNAQQELLNARLALVHAQHDRVIAAYSVLVSVGDMSPGFLGLRVTVYDVAKHYHLVQDGLRGILTPDGR